MIPQANLCYCLSMDLAPRFADGMAKRARTHEAGEWAEMKTRATAPRCSRAKSHILEYHRHGGGDPEVAAGAVRRPGDHYAAVKLFHR